MLPSLSNMSIAPKHDRALGDARDEQDSGSRLKKSPIGLDLNEKLLTVHRSNGRVDTIRMNDVLHDHYLLDINEYNIPVAISMLNDGELASPVWETASGQLNDINTLAPLELPKDTQTLYALVDSMRGSLTYRRIPLKWSEFERINQLSGDYESHKGRDDAFYRNKNIEIENAKRQLQNDILHTFEEFGRVMHTSVSHPLLDVQKRVVEQHQKAVKILTRVCVDPDAKFDQSEVEFVFGGNTNIVYHEWESKPANVDPELLSLAIGEDRRLKLLLSSSLKSYGLRKSLIYQYIDRINLDLITDPSLFKELESYGIFTNEIQVGGKRFKGREGGNCPLPFIAKTYYETDQKNDALSMSLTKATHADNRPYNVYLTTSGLKETPDQITISKLPPENDSTPRVEIHASYYLPAWLVASAMAQSVGDPDNLNYTLGYVWCRGLFADFVSPGTRIVGKLMVADPMRGVEGWW